MADADTLVNPQKIRRNVTRCVCFPIRIILGVIISLTGFLACILATFIVFPVAFPQLEQIPIISRVVNTARWMLLNPLIDLLDRESGLLFLKTYDTNVAFLAADVRVTALLIGVAGISAFLNAFWI